MEIWHKHTPGKNPLCLVGAGFQRGVLKCGLPTTETLIKETVKGPDSQKFPILKELVKRVVNTELNFIWTHIECMAVILSDLSGHFVSEYGSFPANSRIANLANRLAYCCSPKEFVWLLLGLELKRMLALQYGECKFDVRQMRKPLAGLDKLAARKRVTWISLNYDLVLERFLASRTIDWQYAFHCCINGTFPPERADHVVIKPHGSLNVWFETVWDSPRLHDLFFVDVKNLLVTCPVDEIGDDSKRNPVRELRPWLIGYVPEIQKDETNSPGQFADFAHDLCKWNLTYAALLLRHASALYILGYSIPPEDEWIWNRLRAVREKRVPIYVASGPDSDRIVERLKDCEFYGAKKLRDDGMI